MKNWLGLIFGVVLAGTFLTFSVAKEVPTGSVKGRVTMKENGRPLEDVSVTLHQVGKDEDAESEGRTGVYRIMTSKDGSFQVKQIPVGTYTVGASASQHSLDSTAITVNEGQTANLDVRLTPNNPSLRLYASQKVFVPTETPAIELHGFIPDPVVKVKVFKLDSERTASAGGVSEAVQRIAYPSDSNRGEVEKDLANVVKSFDYQIQKKDEEGAFIEPLGLTALPEGLYVIECTGGGQTARTFLNVSKIALVTKTVGTSSLCYVTDLKTGDPIADAEILDRKDGKLVSIARTSDKGLAEVNFTASQNHAVVGARYKDSVALCGLYVSGDHDDGSKSNQSGTIFTYTDRPIYRPGDTVQFKGVVRILKGSDYVLPEQGDVNIEVRDSEETLVEKFTAKVNAHGTYSGKFSTNKEAAPGVYVINAEYKGIKDRYSVNLAAYRKPDYNITIKPEKEHYYMGERARAVLSCQYYYGAPVVGAKVRAFIYRSPIWWDSDSDGSDDSSNSQEDYYTGNRGGQYSQDVELVTDANGRAVIEFETKTDGDPDEFESDYSYQISATVQDAGDKSTTGEGKVRVNRGTVSILLTPSSYIASPGQTVGVKVNLKSLENDSAAINDKTVELRIGKREWTKNESEFKLAKTLFDSTNKDGLAEFKVPIGAKGSVSLQAIVRDGSGRVIKAENSVYVEGGVVDQPDADNFTLKLEKKKFQAGEEIKAMLQSNQGGGVALVTLEADKVINKWLIPVTSGSTVFKIPLGVEAVPNAFVSAVLVRNKHFYQTTSEVTVDRPEQKLLVSVVPDRNQAKPGEVVNFKVTTQLPGGKRVPAEVSLAVVDEGIFAIRKDSTDILKGLFPHRYSRVETNYSFPEVYLDGGDKAGGNVKVRTNFKDTAQWDPAVETNSNGEATVKVTLPDNLTSWRATAVAATDQSAVGQSTANIRVRKDLMVRLSMPQFLVEQDEQQVAMTVTNDTDKDADISLSVESSGLVLTGSVPRTLRIGRGRSEVVDLKVGATQSGAGSITAKAWIQGGDSDGVQHTINVLPHGNLKFDAFAGQIEKSGGFETEIDPNADKSAGNLTVTLSPSLVSGMVQSLDSLIQFPYGCVEQTMSRFMPAILVSKTLKESGLIKPELDQKVPLIAADGFARLAKMQHDNGGWGWWEYDDSSIFMTSWVLDGLLRASKAGYATPDSISVEKALDWASSQANTFKSEGSLTDKVFLIYALAEHGRTKVAQEAMDRLSFDRASAGELALAALAEHALGRTSASGRYLDRLRSSAKTSSETAYWDSTGYYWYGSEDTSLALLAFTTCASRDDLIPKIIRYLMQSKSGEGWSSTRATSITLAGLCEHISTHPISTDPSTVSLIVNGKTLRNWTLDKASLLNPDLRVEIPIKDLPTGKNKIEFTRTGNGFSYYSAAVKQYIREKNIVQVIQDVPLRVERNYYLLSAQQVDDGTMKLMPSKRPISEAKSGDIIRCELTIRAASQESYVLIEDAVPSNCRVTEREDPGEDSSWNWWWSSTVIRDDRISFFARSLPAGVNKITYTFRAESPGISAVLPTRVGNMYNPSSTVMGGENRLKVMR